LENNSGMRLTEVIAEVCGSNIKTAVWVGPGHVQNFLKGIPSCMIIDSESPELSKSLAEQLSSDLIRIYYGNDIIGTEVGAAAKNVVGIAAGMLDGLGYHSLKGALMARGASEFAKLIVAMGGRSETVYGLSHLGDYEATLFSPYSHNREFGEDFVSGREFKMLAEGVSTVKSLVMLSEKYGIELPISKAVCSVIYEGLDVREGIMKLFSRPLKSEFQQ
ncbi:MAG: glycerol-3-phosphate dehydrogenase, partial [Clostridia bacterium]|nr:glycerol-3-phosphate dehydrogenase [Clostridia bacterium]